MNDKFGPFGNVSSWSASSYSCPSVGHFGSVNYCPRCRWGEWCEAIHSASIAPLCSLPQYMVSRYPDVRHRANSRYDEIMMSRQDPA